jgi:hypothetical protein
VPSARSRPASVSPMTASGLVVFAVTPVLLSSGWADSSQQHHLNACGVSRDRRDGRSSTRSVASTGRKRLRLAARSSPPACSAERRVESLVRSALKRARPPIASRDAAVQRSSPQELRPAPAWRGLVRLPGTSRPGPVLRTRPRPHRHVVRRTAFRASRSAAARAAAFVRRQRYTSEAALQRMPKTTDELLSNMELRTRA